MKHVLAIVTLSAVLFPAVFSQTDRDNNLDDGTIRVMSLNIRFNNPDDGPDAWPNRRAGVAALILREAPDLIGMQEVRPDQLIDLGQDLPGWSWIGLPRVDGGPTDEYSVIFYNTARFDVLDNGTFWLSETPDVPASQGWDAALPRIVTWGRFRDRTTGRELLHANTHFDHRGERARRESAYLLKRWIGEHASSDPVVVTGDFNALPASAPIQALTAPGTPGLRDALTAALGGHEGPTSTWSGFRAIEPGRRLDYIFVNTELTVLTHEILSDKLADGRFPSDHLPVVAELSTVSKTPGPIHIIPAPVSVIPVEAAPFMLGRGTPVVVDGPDPELPALASMMNSYLGADRSMADALAPIRLVISRALSLPAGGYTLQVRSTGVRIEAGTPAGLFYGMQTLHQLAPVTSGSGVVPVPAVDIVDSPRYEWRGAMLDVARHFFGVADVKKYMDYMAMYKLNMLHLHLSDDQGWRIEIPSRPELTEIGSLSAVGGGPGGYYSTADYQDLVRYAAARFITIVPEIDMPGHTNAALSSIAEINCDAKRTRPYTGIEVGFSTLCVDKEATYRFVDDVVGELARLSPGPYFHIGGDEVKELSASDYARFMERAETIVRSHGKTVVAWDEVAETELRLPLGTVIQVWRPQQAETGKRLTQAVRNGARLVLSPADRIYLDMKYDASSSLGLSWAGYNDVRDAYEWEPANLVAGVPEPSILGVEAPLWTETADSMDDLEWLAFPRLAGAAETAWSPRSAKDWLSYRPRLLSQYPRWDAMGINYYRSPLLE